jgi:hypothetical protein
MAGFAGSRALFVLAGDASGLCGIFWRVKICLAIYFWHVFLSNQLPHTGEKQCAIRFDGSLAGCWSYALLD